MNKHELMWSLLKYRVDTEYEKAVDYFTKHPRKEWEGVYDTFHYIQQLILSLENMNLEDTINSAIAELYALNVPDAEYKYEVVDGCWIDIKHNISDLISVDDEIAYKTGEVLKKCLVDRGITHFSFYQGD